jgi:hypothetical protein
MSDTKRGVIRPRGCFLAGFEDVTEVSGSGSQAAVDNNVPLKVQVGEGGPKVVPGSFKGDGISGDVDTVELLGGTTVKEHVDGPDNLSAAVLRMGFSGDYFSLICIVVENSAAFFKVCM